MCRLPHSPNPSNAPGDASSAPNARSAPHSPNLLHFERQGAVALLTLDYPATRNAISPPMRQALCDAIAQVRDDTGIRAVVITGADGHFCSGGDLRNIAATQPDPARWRQRLHQLHHALRDLLSLDKAVISAIDGAAFGAGLGLALAADFVLVTPRARLCASFLKIGLVPDFGLFYTLPRSVGVQRARELMLSAREVGAEEALRLGLAMEMHAPHHLLARALQLAHSLANASPMAVSLIKRATAADSNLTQCLGLEADAQALAMAAPEHRQALQAFFDKRSPVYQWPIAP